MRNGRHKASEHKRQNTEMKDVMNDVTMSQNMWRKMIWTRIFSFLNSEWKEKARRARKLKTYNEFCIFDRGNESRIEISNFLSKITGNLHLPFIYHFL